MATYEEIKARNAQRSATGNLAAAKMPEGVEDDGILKSVADFTDALSPGKNIPILGELAARAGSAFVAPFSEKTYGQLEDERRKEGERLQRRHPIASFAGQVAGGVALPVPTFRAALPVAQRVGGWISKLMQGAVLGGGDAVVQGGLAAGDAALRGNDAGDAAKWAGGAATALPLMGKAASLGAGAGRSFLGVGKEVAEKYRARRPQIKEQLEQIAPGGEDATAEKILAATDRRLTAAAEAEDALRQEKTNVPSVVFDLLGQQTAATSARSSQAFKALEGRSISLDKARRFYSKAVDNMRFKKGSMPLDVDEKKLGRIGKIMGDISTQPETPENIAKKVFGEMGISPNARPRNAGEEENFIRTLHNLATSGPLDAPIEAGEAKRFVQMLDELEAGAWTKLKKPGGRLDRTDKTIIALRRYVDADLKKIPEYRQIMGPLAEQTNFLNIARKRFSTENKVASELNRRPERAFRDIRNLSPGYLPASDPLQKLTAAQYRQSVAVPAAEAVHKIAGKTPGMMDPIQRAIKSQLRAQPSADTRTALQRLGREEGEDFMQQIEDRNIARQLTGGVSQGSAKANVGEAVGRAVANYGGRALFGSVLGGFGGSVGLDQGAGGAAAGALMGLGAGVKGKHFYRSLSDIKAQPFFSTTGALLDRAAAGAPQVLGREWSEEDDELAKHLKERGYR